MKKRVLISTIVLLAVGVIAALAAAPSASKGSGGKPEWSMNATIIEACSCTMFCQCYFNKEPMGHEGHEGHGGGHFCQFNNAFKVNKGWHKGVKLDGAKFWVAGDLGSDFSKGQMDWAVVTFDKAMTPEQRAAVGDIIGHLYPVKWSSLKTAEGEIDWKAGKGEARALLNGGKTAEVALKGTESYNDADKPVVIKNLKYWGAPKNDGFVLMPNTVEAYRAGDKPFEFKGTNGFMITFEIDSKNAPPAAG